jgi:hypothetical protein
MRMVRLVQVNEPVGSERISPIRAETIGQ